MNLAAYSVVGLGIGVLAGLSVSPVLSVVLTSLISTAAAANVLLSQHVKRDSSEAAGRYSAWPLAILVVGVVLGSLGGIWARTTLALFLVDQRKQEISLMPSENLTDVVNAWVGVGVERNAVVAAVFQQHFGLITQATSSIESATTKPLTAGLFSVSADECKSLIGKAAGESNELRNGLRIVRSAAARELADNLEDEDLVLLVKVLCNEDEI